MPLNNPAPGFGAVPEYMASALPWLTTSTLSAGEVRQYSFDYITKWIIVKNLSSTTLHVGVTQNGVQGSNYMELGSGDSFNLDWRVPVVFLSASVGTPKFTLIAGLTAIPSRMTYPLTSSNGWNGVG